MKYLCAIDMWNSLDKSSRPRIPVPAWANEFDVTLFHESIIDDSRAASRSKGPNAPNKMTFKKSEELKLKSTEAETINDSPPTSESPSAPKFKNCRRLPVQVRGVPRHDSHPLHPNELTAIDFDKKQKQAGFAADIAARLKAHKDEQFELLVQEAGVLKDSIDKRTDPTMEGCFVHDVGGAASLQTVPNSIARMYDEGCTNDGNSSGSGGVHPVSTGSVVEPDSIMVSDAATPQPKRRKMRTKTAGNA